MEQIKILEDNLRENASKTIKHLQSNFLGLRTNVVSPDLLNSVNVEAHGQIMPMKAVASVTLKDSQTLHVQVWDKFLIRSVEKGIRDSNLNLNPTLDGDAIFIKVPSLTQERRKELIKTMKEYKEKAKISIRNHRHDAINALKKLEKSKDISEDDQKKGTKLFDSIIEKNTKEIDVLSNKKESDILN